jgi:hypothetical protein
MAAASILRGRRAVRGPLAALLLGLALLAPACGGEDDASSGDVAEVCRHEFDCRTGACACTVGPRSGDACCEPAQCGPNHAQACNVLCRYCTTR